MGDVNNDGIVDTGDAVVILKYAADMVMLDDRQMQSADTNRDSYVDTSDAVMILRYAAGMIEEF